MVAAVVLVVDEGVDGGFQFTFEEVIFQQNAVLEGLSPPIDLALGLGMQRGAANMFYTFVVKVFGQIHRDTRRAEISRFVGKV